jgi:hypothetical protein
MTRTRLMDGGISPRPSANELTGEGRRPLVATSLSLRQPAAHVAPGLTFGMVGMGVCAVMFVFPLQYLGREPRTSAR